MNIIEEVTKMIIGHTLLVAYPHFINMILGVYMGPKFYACVPMSHDKKFQNCVRRTLSRVCRRVILDFTAMSIFTHVYP